MLPLNQTGSSGQLRADPDYVDDAVRDYVRSRNAARYQHTPSKVYESQRRSARKRSSPNDSGPSRRSRRHVGAHDAEGLQRIISTGTVEFVFRFNRLLHRVDLLHTLKLYLCKI